jgi:hypothetical protein
VNGHNNKIEVTAKVANTVLSGHNNKIYCNSNSSHSGELDNICVLGHNNRIENLTVKTLTVNGHNNSFIGLLCGTITD